jgi:hypothetical protein
MTAMFTTSFAGTPDPKTERALAAVLRNCAWDEAAAALAELIEQSAELPAVVDVASKLEAVRRRGPLAAPGKVATRAVRARALLRARRALFVPREEPRSA